jgi:restriction endonuclease in pPIWI_RE module
LAWCERPFEEWPLPLGDLARNRRLLEDGIPSDYCDALACSSVDVEAEMTEQGIMLGALSVCQDAAAQDSYVAFRRLLIERPVLTALDLQQQLARPELRILTEQLKAAYRPAPSPALVDGHYHCCAGCNNLLLRTARRGLTCEDDTCRRASGRRGNSRRIPAREEVSWLAWGLRRFVAGPGRTEVRLAERLAQCGAMVSLWPSFDQYDLRIVFPDGDAWAVDVKDYGDPVLLASRLNERAAPGIAPSPPWSRAYFVFPNDRRAQRSDYARAFRNRFRHLSRTVRAGFEADLLRDVRQKLAEGGGYA